MQYFCVTMYYIPTVKALRWPWAVDWAIVNCITSISQQKIIPPVMRRTLLRQMDMASLTCTQIWVHAVHTKGGQHNHGLHKNWLRGTEKLPLSLTLPPLGDWTQGLRIWVPTHWPLSCIPSRGGTTPCHLPADVYIQTAPRVIVLTSETFQSLLNQFLLALAYRHVSSAVSCSVFFPFLFSPLKPVFNRYFLTCLELAKWLTMASVFYGCWTWSFTNWITDW